MPPSTKLAVRKKIFKENLRDMAGFLGKSFKEVAMASGLGRKGYKWLRRAVTRGIHGPSQANVAHLKKLAGYLGPRFHFKQVGDLWSPNLVHRALHEEVVKRSGLNVPDEEAVRMFRELVETKEFSYLKNLIADLHRLSNVQR
jgi:hypothetical protein